MVNCSQSRALDKIALIDVQFWAYHGVFAEEQTLGQRFHFDVILELDLSKAGQTDALEDSVSYADVYKVLETVVVGERFQLLEALAHTIVKRVFMLDARIEGVEVCVRKPQAPIPGHFSHASVTIKRYRSEV